MYNTYPFAGTCSSVLVLSSSSGTSVSLPRTLLPVQAIPNPLLSYTFPIDIHSSTRFKRTKEVLADYSKRAVSVRTRAQATVELVDTTCMCMEGYVIMMMYEQVPGRGQGRAAEDSHTEQDGVVTLLGKGPPTVEGHAPEG